MFQEMMPMSSGGGDSTWFNAVICNSQNDSRYWSTYGRTDDVTLTGQTDYTSTDTDNFSIQLIRPFKGKLVLTIAQRGGNVTHAKVMIGSTEYGVTQQTQEWDVDIPSGTTITFYGGHCAAGYATSALLVGK